MDALGAQEVRELLDMLELGGFAGPGGGRRAAVELPAHKGALHDDGGDDGGFEVRRGGVDEVDEAHDVNVETVVPVFGRAVHVRGGCCHVDRVRKG